MPLVIGLCITPFVVLIMRASQSVSVKKRTAVMLNLLLLLISAAFLVFALKTRMEPFDFEIYYSEAYMLFSGGYIINAACVYAFTPFMWIITVHFFRLLLRSLRVRKNAVIKRDKDFLYYRDDLDKISPGIIIFASELEVDVRRSITSEILKLKLMGYIEENCGNYVCTPKETDILTASEQMLLNSVKSGRFDAAEYKRIIEAETLKGGFIVQNRGGKSTRLLKIITAFCIPVMVFASSVWLDNYVHKNYQVYPDPNGYTYILLERQADVEKLLREVTDENDYYSEMWSFDNRLHYTHSKILADRFQYSVVRKALILRLIALLSIWLVFASVFAAVYRIAEQIIYFDKNYKRTIKGKALLNKAYALKNYLRDYSVIKDRTAQELPLWEYYLVYAVALDVNERVEDEVIKKYVREML